MTALADAGNAEKHETGNHPVMRHTARSIHRVSSLIDQNNICQS
jgi:hypothetical protein